MIVEALAGYLKAALLIGLTVGTLWLGVWAVVACTRRRRNILGMAMLAALFMHVSFVTGLYAMGVLMPTAPLESRVAVAFRRDPPKPHEERPPEPPRVENPKDTPRPVTVKPPDKPPEMPKDIKLPKTFELPIGRMDIGDPTVKKIRKGSTMVGARIGAPGSNPDSKSTQVAKFGNMRTLSIPTDDASGDVIDNPDMGGDIMGWGDSLDPRLPTWGVATGAEAGNGGADLGVADGDPDGGIPVGFPQGKMGGRVYFARLKQDNKGAWLSNNEGTKRLLAFLNNEIGIPCQSETWPIDAQRLNKYLDKGEAGVPSFLYLYVDENFTLTKAEVAVMQRYVAMGGFLFMDARPIPSIKDKVAEQLKRVFPDGGQALRPLPATHPVNRYLFDLPFVAYGENVLPGKANYGVTKGDRLVAFFTSGNFSHIYSLRPYAAGTDEFIKATYQMGVNIMFYAITKGNPEGMGDRGMAKKKGASAQVTLETLARLGIISTASAPKPAGAGDPVGPPVAGGTTPPGAIVEPVTEPGDVDVW